MRRLPLPALALAAWGIGTGCAGRLPAVSFDQPPAGGPVWPPPPDPPHVRWLAELVLPGASFVRPIDVACGREHRLAVADPDAGTVWLIDLGGGRFRGLSTAAGAALATPVGVAFMDDGTLVVADPGLQALFRSRSGGRRLRLVHRGEPLVRPAGLVATAGSTVLVVDPGAHALFRTGSDWSGLAWLAGSRGPAGDGFNYPVDAAMSPEGEVYVADALNSAVQVVVEGEAHFFVGGEGTSGGQLVRPKGLALDALSRLHVVDAGMQHVQVYDSEGRLLGRYGRPGSGAGELALPAGICIDEHHHVFVADSLNRRLQIYELVEPQP